MRPHHTQHLHRVCKRYGPGRLPGAQRPAIGAGYAAATAALVAALLFAVAAITAEVVGLLSSNDGVVWFAFAGLAVPVVVPVAFAVGVAVWRLLPAALPFFGPLSGLLGTVGTYVGSLFAVALVLSGAAALGVTTTDPATATTFSVGVVLLAFMITWWVAFPVGIVSGTVYAAVVAESE